MKPLKQWKCDLCGNTIEDARDGKVIWKENNRGQIDIILIVHDNIVDNEACIKFNTYNSAPLDEFLGYQGIIKCLSLFDPKPNFKTDYINRIANVRLFLDVYRRTQIKYYEEARLYWDNAINDGFIDAYDDITLFKPETLKRIIKKYKQKTYKLPKRKSGF